ncbi:MAG TPA: chromate resistance protein ChrB domain-containing protein [Casimicrobiaceae bacterium]|nr:chromate resistance protein ChrB domain-containing protein [Casimicrobiaceae bacterium]
MPAELASCSPAALRTKLLQPFPPTLIDVRKSTAFERDPVRIPLSIRRDHEAVEQWADGLDGWREVVCYCVHGHEVSQNAANALRAKGFDATILDGGLEGWRGEGLPIEPWRPPTRWVTRERPKIDRIACPWLVRRRIDASAQFDYVPANEVRAFAKANDAVPFDIPDVEYGHVGERCSFDAFVARHVDADAALAQLADIVRAADTDTLDRAAQASGLLAISHGLGRGIGDDATLLRYGMLVYDALHAWCARASKVAARA